MIVTLIGRRETLIAGASRESTAVNGSDSVASSPPCCWRTKVGGLCVEREWATRKDRRNRLKETLIPMLCHTIYYTPHTTHHSLIHSQFHSFTHGWVYTCMLNKVRETVNWFNRKRDTTIFLYVLNSTETKYIYGIFLSKPRLFLTTPGLSLLPRIHTQNI